MYVEKYLDLTAHIEKDFKNKVTELEAKVNNYLLNRFNK
jgi:hypothetical protein